MITRLVFRWPRSRRAVTLLGITLVCVLGVWPRSALAACGTFDPMACFDGAIYNNLLIPLMEWLWAAARGWLILARIIEGVRTWLVTEVLSLAFDAIIAGIQFPFWIAAMLATVVFAVAFALQGIVEGLHWVQVKRAVTYLALAVFLFNIGSPAVAASEQIRLAVGQGLAGIAGTSASQTSVTFYADDDSSMDEPHTIYGGESDCPGMTVARDEPAMYLNDYTANYAWATAEDIHCPTYAEGSPRVPVAFARRYIPAEGQPIEQQTETDRKRLMGLAWGGVARLLMVNILAIGADIEQTMQLIYALALQALWLGVYLSLLFVLFVPMEGIFHQQINSAKNLYFASWRAAFFFGLAMTLLHQAAQRGNGLVVAGIGGATVALTIWQTVVAGKAGSAALDSFGQTMGAAPQAISGAAKGIGGGLLGGAVTAAAFASGMGLPAAIGIGNAAKRSPGNAMFRWAMMRQRTGRQAERQADAGERREASADRAERAELRQDRRLDLDAARDQREQEAHDWQWQDRARGPWYDAGGLLSDAPTVRVSPGGSAAAPEPEPTPEQQVGIAAIVALLRTPASEEAANPGAPTGGTAAGGARGDSGPTAVAEAPDQLVSTAQPPTSSRQPTPANGASAAPAHGASAAPTNDAPPPAGPARRTADHAPQRDQAPAAAPAAPEPGTSGSGAREGTANGTSSPDVTRAAAARQQDPSHPAAREPRPQDEDRAVPPPATATTAATSDPAAPAAGTKTRRPLHWIMTLAGHAHADCPTGAPAKPRVRSHAGRIRSGTNRAAGQPRRVLGIPGAQPAAGHAVAPATSREAAPPSDVVRDTTSVQPGGPGRAGAVRPGAVLQPPTASPPQAAPRPARPSAAPGRPASGIVTGAAVLDQARAQRDAAPDAIGSAASMGPSTTQRPTTGQRVKPWTARAQRRDPRRRTSRPDHPAAPEQGAKGS
jgi:uncharacterized membrane protein YciS (DUF1049 family)